MIILEKLLKNVIFTTLIKKVKVVSKHYELIAKKKYVVKNKREKLVVSTFKNYIERERLNKI